LQNEKYKILILTRDLKRFSHLSDFRFLKTASFFKLFSNIARFLLTSSGWPAIFVRILLINLNKWQYNSPLLDQFSTHQPRCSVIRKRGW